MKKQFITIASLTCVLALSGCSSKIISEEEAKKVAFNDAGIKESDVTFTEQTFDKDDNEYSFSFYTNEYRYEYEINGDGSIESQKKKTQNNANTNNDAVTGATTDASGASLSEEQWTYLNIALTHFNVKSEEVKGVKVQKDMEDGIEVYDVDFYKDNKEYNCEIRIDNQEILKSDIDQD